MADVSAKTDTAPQGQQPEAQPPKLKEPQKPRTVKYFVDRKSLLIKAAVLLAALSVLFRLIGYWGFWSDPASDATYSQVFLPIVCCLLFMAPGGVFIVSGIIGDRAGETASALKQNGFEIVSRRFLNDWHSFTCI